jgi:hypothetical protein
MNQLAILFHDPNFGISIEDALEEAGIAYSIERTPTSLLEIDPFYCKTFIFATDISIDTFNHLRHSKQLTIAGVYAVSDGRYEAIESEVA